MAVQDNIMSTKERHNMKPIPKIKINAMVFMPIDWQNPEGESHLKVWVQKKHTIGNYVMSVLKDSGRVFTFKERD